MDDNGLSPNRTRILYHAEQKIKSEPKDKTPPYLPQFGEQWLGENIPGALQIPGTSTNPFGQEIWAAQSYVQHPSTSPNLQQLSPQMGQNLHVLTSSVPAMSPNLQPMSPNMPLSPHAQVMSPQGQVLSPHGQVMSPHGQVMSPHGQVMSPHGQVMSPHGQVMSPHGQAMSPHGQVMSPHGQVMSPHGQAMTHNLQVMSPQHMGRISPNMPHPQANMGHISPNLVQQVQHIQPTQAQLNQGMMETDTNSTPSLSNLLLDRGEGLTLYSGELSALLGD